jgi:hypothetical protein
MNNDPPNDYPLHISFFARTDMPEPTSTAAATLASAITTALLDNIDPNGVHRG